MPDQYDLSLVVLLKVQINRKKDPRIQVFHHTFDRVFTIKRRRRHQKFNTIVSFNQIFG